MANLINQKLYTYYYLYKTTCLTTNRVYIGVHATDNLNDGYLGSGKILKRAITKYGKDNFSKEIIKFFNSATEMFAAEAEAVNEDFVNSDISMNLVVGGSGGFKVQDIDSWKVKLSESSKARISKTPFAGKQHSADAKNKISNAHKGRTPWNLGKPGTFTNKTHSEESKKKISNSRKGLTAGENNPMYGKSAVAGRKWYNDGTKAYLLYPDDPATDSLNVGRRC